MKVIASLFLVFCLVGCGTIGGAVSGAGKDLQSLGKMIQE